MRESRSWPRSSVPNGCRQDGGFRRAVKSISLIGTVHNHGPVAKPMTITNKISAPTSANRCRLKRRQMSSESETVRARLKASGGLAERDARVEPAIQDIRQQVERNHQ